jgi:hypothetical protein
MPSHLPRRRPYLVNEMEKEDVVTSTHVSDQIKEKER